MNTMHKILIIDDESDMLELLEYNLVQAGYEVLCFTNTKGVQDALDTQDIALLLVDRNLISEDGLDFVKSLRQKGYENAVIFVSAKGARFEKIAGLESGGDDYISKPFDIDELKARIKAVLKRTNPSKTELRHKNIYINVDENIACIDDEKITLSALEMRLLVYFLTNKKRLISRYDLLNDVWGDESVSQKAINIAISRLKRKLGKASDMIEAIRSQGYKLC